MTLVEKLMQHNMARDRITLSMLIGYLQDYQQMYGDGLCYVQEVRAEMSLFEGYKTSFEIVVHPAPQPVVRIERVEKRDWLPKDLA